MSRIVFVPVGTSAAENQELVEHSPDLKDAFGDEDARKLLRSLEGRWDQLNSIEQLLLAAHRNFWKRSLDYRHDPGKFRQTSAETISTYTAAWANILGNGGQLQGGHDKVVFLASDTTLGQLCARINEKLFREYLFGATPAKAKDIAFETLEDLSPGEPDKPISAVYPQVRKIIDQYLDAAPHSQAVFNITGGYKALIPPITHIAWSERLQARMPQLLYMHESMSGTVTLIPEQNGKGYREVFTRSGGYVNH